MQILVTGACTHLGQTLLRALVARDTLLGALGAPVRVERIIALDRAQPAPLFLEPRIEYVSGTFEQSRFLARVMGTATDSIFHLSSLGAGARADSATGGALEDLDDALMRSLDTTRSLLDACQYQSAQPRIVLASSLDARRQGDAPPPTAEGTCNALCELFLVECARRGYIDLRGVRLPTIADQGGGNTAGAECITAEGAAAALIAAHEGPRAFAGPGPFVNVPGFVPEAGDEP